ncbi:MAG: flap endonuclease-1 [Methanobacteriota archaeon]|nr:MAG: flap endonuclease-1 [Euryarchaeota archaeon]
MGVNFTPIAVKETISLDRLAGRTLAVDASIELYQFLSIMRLPDGSPLSDGKGRVTSHLNGILFRSTRLISEHKARLLYVFDGRPPALKWREIEKRREAKAKAEREYAEAVARGDREAAWSKVVMTTRVTREMKEDAQRLLELLGIPWVQAPSEGEAQASWFAKEGKAWAVSSKDYDSLLFGAPRLARFVGIKGREFLPSRGVSRIVPPEVIDLAVMLRELGLTRRQLIEAAILVGTDFNEGVRGVGPKTAVKLLREHGSLEALPAKIRDPLPPNVDEIRGYFLEPEVDASPEIRTARLDPEGVVRFLVDERGFTSDRVRAAVERLRDVGPAPTTLDDFPP